MFTHKKTYGITLSVLLKYLDVPLRKGTKIHALKYYGRVDLSASQVKGPGSKKAKKEKI